MGNVGDVDGEALFAKLAVEDLLFLTILPFLESADVLVDVDGLLPANQHALEPLLLLGLPGLGLGLTLLQPELPSAPVVHLGRHPAPRRRCHLF